MFYFFFTFVYYVSAQFSNFENCKQNALKQNTYPINLKQFIFNPNPIEIGKILVMNVSGLNSARILPGAKINAAFYYNNKLVENKSYDLCNDLIETSGGKCPVETGDFNITAKSIPLVSASYPVNTSYSFSTIFTGKYYQNIYSTIILILFK